MKANFENRDFDSTQFLGQEFLERETKNMVKAPSKSVFDQEPYQPRNEGDWKEIELPVTYNKYKFNQL